MEIRFLNLKTVTDAQLSLWESWLAPEKRQRIDRMPPQKRLQSLCADALARQMLSAALQITPEQVQISYDRNGKPVTNGACFSVSHSGDVVVCAVSQQPIGVSEYRISEILPQEVASDLPSIADIESAVSMTNTSTANREGNP